jgi:serine/threonine protein kinase
LGIPHRDIKPDNIAVGMVGRGDRLHLVLFDFSLSRMPADNIRAGTNGYLDPLLPLRKPPRWDHWHLGTQNFVKISTLTPEEEQATSRSLEETLAKDTEDICAVPRPAR